MTHDSQAVGVGRETLRFVLDGEVVNVKDVPATTTVLEYLRCASRTGTKEGCAEGDCGACTVVLGELAADRQSIVYRAINSCIRFLPTIDGKELVTAESLQADARTLHPVQQSMVDNHGSQCGFCTPGFVMSLFALYLNNSSARRSDVIDALAGNLCRCTGYRPIIEAGCRMSEYPEPARWSRALAQSKERLDLLKLLNGDPSGTLQMPGFKAPRTIDELATIIEAAPDALILAGGTDVGLYVTKHLRDLPSLIYIGEVAELSVMRSDAKGLWIGAAVTLSAAWPALVKAFPALEEQARRFASPPICNSATLGGNVANGSPIGDSLPSLIALGAEVELRKGKHARSLPLEQFYLGYQKKDLRPGEFLVGIRVPVANAATRIASYKLAKRFDQDISAVCAAFAVELAGDRVIAARLAFGGMAATPARAPKAEAALIGKSWSLTSCNAAAAALAEDFKPLTDMRASSHYRLQAAANLLRRFYLQQSPGAPPTRTAQALESVERL